MGIENKKDFWDKLKIYSFVAIPIIIAFLGHSANISLKEKDVGVRMVEMAVGILKEDPKDNPETPALRKWATSIIEKYSKVKLTKSAKKELEEKPLPKTVAWSTQTAQTEGIEQSYFPITIFSQPTGAEIYVDGIWAGKTNLVTNIPAGEHEVRLILNNKERSERIRVPTTKLLIFNFDK